MSTGRFRFARFVRGSIGQLLLAIYRVRFIGTDNIPEGPAIIAGNHVSYLDPSLLWCRRGRPIHFMAKAPLFDMPVMGWVLPRFWAIPVHQGSADRAAISAATELLDAGELVGIFPEGTRIRHGGADALGEGQGGVAFIAMRANAPVVPVGIAGTERAWPEGQRLPRFPRVTILFGEPVRPDDFTEGGRKERVEAMTTEIMQRIASAREAARKV